MSSTSPKSPAALQRQVLTRQLQALTRRSRAVRGDLRALHDRDWTERAIEIENDEVLEGLDAVVRQEVLDIVRALRHIDNGQYGVCARCQQEIGATRLRALPAAVICARCAGTK
jgi:RNA polymerase-binding transcription factor DksA